MWNTIKGTLLWILDFIDGITKIDKLLAGILIAFIITLILSNVFSRDKKIFRSIWSVIIALKDLSNKIIYDDAEWGIIFYFAILSNVALFYFTYQDSLSIIILPFALIKTIIQALSKLDKENFYKEADNIFKELLKSNGKIILGYYLILHQLPDSFRKLIESDFKVDLSNLITLRDISVFFPLTIFTITISYVMKKLIIEKYIFAKCEQEYMRISFINNKNDEMFIHELHKINKGFSKCSIEIVQRSKVMNILYKMDKSLDLLKIRMDKICILYSTLKHYHVNEDDIIEFLTGNYFIMSSDLYLEVLLNNLDKIDFDIVGEFEKGKRFILNKVAIYSKEVKRETLTDIILRLLDTKSIEEVLINIKLIERVSKEDKMKLFNEYKSKVDKVSYEFINFKTDMKMYKNNYSEEINRFREFIEEYEVKIYEMTKLDDIVYDFFSTSQTFLHSWNVNGEDVARATFFSMVENSHKNMLIELSNVKEYLRNI